MAAPVVPLPIEVPLREKRTYLHSTNLFDFLVLRTGASRNLSLTFRRKIECEVEALPAADCDNVQDYPARFSGEGADGGVDLVLREKLPLTPFRRHEPYNEDAVANGSRIDGSAILSDSANGASAIERIVSLNKRLLTAETGGQKVLVFSKLFLKSIPGNQANLKISLKSRPGLTLFRSMIVADNGEVGEIIFYGT